MSNWYIMGLTAVPQVLYSLQLLLGLLILRLMVYGIQMILFLVERTGRVCFITVQCCFCQQNLNTEQLFLPKDNLLKYTFCPSAFLSWIMKSAPGFCYAEELTRCCCIRTDKTQFEWFDSGYPGLTQVVFRHDLLKTSGVWFYHMGKTGREFDLSKGWG